MKTLISFFIAGLLMLSACSSPSQDQPKEQYPKQYGEWIVENPKFGQWVGGESKAAKSNADTLIISKPNQQQLEVVTDDGIEDGVTFTIVDKDINKGDVSPTKTVLGLPNDAFIGSGSDQQHFGIRGGFYGFDHYLKLEFDLKINCQSSSNQKHFFVTMFTEDDRVYRVYRFSTSGYIDAIKDVAGCPMP